MFLFCTLQVSSKVVELGISQWNIDTQRYGLVDYLPYMFQESGILMSALPRPIVTYDSIVYPFDQLVWGSTFACIIAQFLLLQVMQYVYCKASDTPNHIEYVYSGVYHDLINNEHIL